MAIDIGELRGILTLQDQFSGPVDKAAKQVGLFGESFGAVTKFVGLAAGAMTAAGAAIVALGTHGADVADVEQAFGELSRAAGQSADVMLGELRKGTLDTISNFELMKLANKALGTGLVTTSADMGTLASGAKLLADRTGGDTKEAFETLTSAMASGRTAQLKQLGLFVDSKVATEEYAKSLNKSVGDLTDHERATALSQGALKALREELATSGGKAADFGDNIARAKVWVQNFVDELSVAVATSPVLQAGMEALGQAITGAFGQNQQGQVEAIQELVGKFAIGITYVGQAGVVAGQMLVTAFYAAKTAIAAVMTVLAAVGTAIVTVVDELAQMGQAIPGHAKWIDTFASSTADARTFMGELTNALAAETEAAAAGVAGHSEASQALDKLGGVLINVREAMQAAQGAAGGATEAVKTFGGATGEAAARSEQATKAILDANRKLDQDLALIGRAGIDRKIIEAGLAFDAEVAKIEELKELKEAEKNDLIAKAQLRYQMEVEAARAGSDEIRDITLGLQDELAMARTTGLEQQLLAIEQHRQTDLQNLVVYRDRYGEEYAAMVALVNAKYDEMAAKAGGFYATATEFAAAHGLKTRAEMERSALAAEAGYRQMKASGEFTYAALAEAYTAWKKQEAELDQTALGTKLQMFDMIASSASALLTTIFGKSKAAAIAAAIIDTLAAIVKTMSAYPWPWSLVPAAAAAAAGYAQVQKIRETEASFAAGSDFQNFGRGTLAMLHGEERVQTRAQAIAEDDETAREIRALRAEMTGRQETIRVPLEVDGRVLSEVLIRRNRAGFFQVTPA